MKFDWTNFTYDSEWLREAVRIEDEYDGEVGAGYGGIHLGELMANPAYFMGIKRLQGIVVRELRDLLTELNLGIGTEAAFVCARQIVMERLAKPEVIIQEQLWAILEEDEATKGTDLPKPLRAGIKSMIYQVMTEADWETIAQAINQSVYQHLMTQAQILKVA
jgi:flagellar biosynthesis regulator FlaF